MNTLRENRGEGGYPPKKRIPARIFPAELPGVLIPRDVVGGSREIFPEPKVIVITDCPNESADNPFNRCKRNSQMFYLPILTVFFLIANLASATQFAFVVTKNTVTVAADSRVLVFHYENHLRVASDNFCKLRKNGDVFWAASGLMNLMSKPEVGAALGASGDIKDRVERANLVLNKILTQEMLNLKDENPAYFDTIALNQRPVSQFAAFGVHEGRSFLYVQEFMCSEGKAGICTVVGRPLVTCPGKCPDQAFSVEIPRNDAIETFLAANPDYRRVAKPAEEIARKLIEVQRDATPEEVGGAINVLTVTDKGHHWINDEADCEKQWAQQPQ